MKGQIDKILGAYNYSVGKIKRTVGKVADDELLEAEGVFQVGKGIGQKTKGVIKESIQKSSRYVGDVIEEFGQRLQEKGHKKVGRVLEKTGIKLEHMID